MFCAVVALTMVRESEAPGMYLSSRSKAAAAAMLGGVRGADGGGGEGAGRWAIYKGRRGESDTKKKKWNDARRRRGKFQQKQQWYDPRTLKISPHFIPHPLTSSYKQQQNAIPLPNLYESNGKPTRSRAGCTARANYKKCRTLAPFGRCIHTSADCFV